MRDNDVGEPVRWRWLWCCFGVLLAGCGQSITNNTPHPPTLWRLARPSFTPTVMLKLRHSPTPYFTQPMTLGAATATPVPLRLGAPRGTANSAGSYLCIGSLTNNHAVQVEGMLIAVYLLNSEGVPLAVKYVTPALDTLPAGVTLPFSALFEEAAGTLPLPNDSAAGCAAVVVAVRFSAAPTIQLLVVEASTERLGPMLYRVSGVIINRSPWPVRGIQAAVILSEDSGASKPASSIIGYRTLRLPAEQVIAPNALLHFSLDVVTINGAAPQLSVVGQGKPSR
jgi:hypothetical protein